MHLPQSGVCTLTKSIFRRALALVFSVGALIFLLLSRDLFYYESVGFQTTYYVGSFLLVFAIAALLLTEFHFSASSRKSVSLVVFVGSSLPLLIMMETFDINDLFSINSFALLFNFLLVWLILWVFYSITSRFSLSIRITAVILYIMAFANSAVRIFRGTPISALDLYNLRTAAAVSGRYEYPFDFYFFTGTLLLIFVFLLAGLATWRVESKKARWAARGSCVAALAAFALVFSNTPFLNSLEISDYLWNQNIAFEENGMLLSLVYSTKYLHIATPEDYSAANVQQIITGSEANPEQAYAKETLPNGQKPNLIVIMNESFSDLSVLGDFESTPDYMPFVHSLAGSKNTITGTMRVSTFGGGTCNTEFEFLTGNTLAFFPTSSIVYQQYINSDLPSLATNLKAQGYSADAVHPYYSYCWKRDEVYPLLGFDHFYDLDSFHNAKMIGSFVSNCVSDESDFEKVIDLFENKQEGQPMFLFNVTMQNHGGYSRLINAPEESVHMEMDGYTSTAADNYLSLIKASDTAFENLIDYFSTVDEPTIVLMFGDHEPNLPTSFYETLLGKSLDDLTQADAQKRYEVPFVLWANYDITAGGTEAGTISANYLATLLLQTAGLETTPYQDYLNQLSTQIPSINLNGYIGADGNEYSFDEESPYTQLLDDYRRLQYNYMFDKRGRLGELYDPA